MPSIQEAEDKSLVVVEDRSVSQLVAPKLIADDGPAARFGWEECFIGKIRNGYTRKVYLHAVRGFLRWAEVRQVELARITPGLVGQYFDEMPGSAPTKKLHLSDHGRRGNATGLKSDPLLANDTNLEEDHTKPARRS